MILFFRSFFQSKIGIAVTLTFLALIAFAFASMDMSSMVSGTGIAGGERVAVVGDKRISTSDLSMQTTNQVEQLRAQNPNMSMQAFVENGGVEDVLEQMLSRWAIAEYADKLGLRAGARLVDSEIVGMEAFRGFDGNFSDEAFRAALDQRGLTEALVRDDLAMGLLARQLITASSLAPTMPASIARQYSALLGETRSGVIAPLPAAAYAPQGDATNEQLQTYYRENRASYIRPERRVLRYALFTEASLQGLAEPTQAQIAQRYQANAAVYGEVERRALTQLILPTQAAAQALVNEVNGGVSLEAAASSKGLATTNIAASDRASITSSTSQAVAQAVFTAAQGKVSAPAQGPLGWYVMRVDSITRQAGRSLAEVRDEIAAQLQIEQRRLAFTEATNEIDDAFAEGRSLAEVADEYSLEIVTTPQVTANGQIFGTPETAPAELAPIFSLAFSSDEGEPQLAAAAGGEALMLFDVTQIVESSAAPLADIREEVENAWRRDAGLKAAGEAATRVLERVAAGKTLAEAVSEEEAELPAPQEISLNRRDMAQQQVTPVSMLFFSMAEGTTKRLEQLASSSWFIVQLDDIKTDELAQDDPVIASTRRQLANTAGEEYVVQFVAAIEAGLEIETNQAAVDAVIAQLTGDTQ